jgi:dihydrolipoamide dehydrogenase
MIIIGAGAVGMEFASIYARFGAHVEILEALDRPLPLEDAEISAEIAKSYARQKISIRTSTRMESVETTKKGVKVKAGDLTLEAEVLLLAAGRKPVTEGFEKLKLEMQGRQVKVDEFQRTSVKGVYAIGDLIPGPQLAHAASAEGILAVEHIAGHEVRPLNPLRIPAATYCSPEVASVGLTEAAAKEKGYNVAVGRFPWAALGKAQILGETEGLVKVVADEKYGELLGVHIIGPHATDLIAEAAVALECEATVEELYRTVHAHPTLSEALMEAGHGVFGSPIHVAQRKR